MAHIYKLVFPNGKIYIGQTTVEPRIRFNRHRTASRAGSDIRLYRAWRKYGDPILEVLYEVPDEDRFDCEIFEIARHKSTGVNGYNATKGGEGALLTDPVAKEKRRQKLRAVPRTKEWYEKVSKAKMGHEVSEESRAKISAALRTHFDLYGAPKRAGKPQSEETRAKISNTMKGVSKSEETRKRMRLAQQRFRAQQRAAALDEI